MQEAFLASETPEPGNALSELLAEAADSVTGLFKVSMILRRPTSTGRTAKLALVATYTRHYDQDYIWHKVPYLRKEVSTDEWLIERLGEANARRREYFLYCEKHHGRLAYVPEPENRDAKTNSDEQEGPIEESVRLPRSVVTSDLPPSFLAPTSATTFVGNPELGDDEIDALSRTSYSISLWSGPGESLVIPPQPESSLNGQQFECNLCFTIQVVKDAKAWRQVPV